MLGFSDSEDWEPVPDLKVIKAMLERAKVKFEERPTVVRVDDKEIRVGTVLTIDQGQRVWVDVTFNTDGDLTALEGDTY